MDWTNDDEFLKFYRRTLVRQRILEETSAWLLKLTATERFLHLLGRCLTLSLGASHAAVMVKRERYFNLIMSSGLSRIPPSLVRLDVTSPLILELRKNRPARTWSKAAREEMRRLDAVMCFPIFGPNKGELVGLLAVGPQSNKEKYDHEIMAFFHILANDIGVELEKELFYHDSVTDRLTGLYNRGFLDSTVHEIQEHRVASQRIAIAMIDVDHFKKFNDTYGHQAGDAVLRIVSEKIRRNIRKTDTCFRYGGEEFCILFRDMVRRDGSTLYSNSDLFFDTVSELADRLRRNIGDSIIAWEGKTLRVTVSIGLSFLGPTATVIDPDRLIRQADEMLYRAKESGRNQVMAYPNPKHRR